ncbi:type II toxin-antitoxin system RelE/ParE family toxin [Autumnicola musiva]|uniref:Type II toxin-antitoxin system RelE/ParE family toxin n=1 Tax=Autumnicola musiva TaxID=3075589 RepID=A0ABU3D0F2_9FLAO|nr:type II toxin-antitoxin system RelE/ParE family toxin [Zunongwangia sp. F117]MDT0674987.1 type II toxin-antitoxin system RelE/ParE family toxin [Zunongwangia sp. F117]
MKIIWSDFAVESLKGIFDYYKVNVNRKVAEQIRGQILNSTKQFIHFPESGQVELFLEQHHYHYRYILTGNYKIIYRMEENQLFINDVFDVKRNPNRMIDVKRNIG